MRSMKLSLLAAALTVLTAALAPRLHEVTYMGTVTSVGTADIGVMAIDERTGAESSMTFAVVEETEFYRGDHRMTFADAMIAVDERIAVTVNTDVPGNRALVVRLADHHE